MKKFRYLGPTTGVSLADGRVLVLSRGGVYALDPEDPALKLHMHFKRFEALPEPPPAKKPKKPVSEPAAVAVLDAPEPTTTEGGQS